MRMLSGLDSSTNEVRRLQTSSLVNLRNLATAAVANPSPEMVTREFPMVACELFLMRLGSDELRRYKLMKLAGDGRFGNLGWVGMSNV
jgi:hypothetical protein